MPSPKYKRVILKKFVIFLRPKTNNEPTNLAVYTTITQEAFAHFIDPPYIGMRSVDLVVIARPSDRESGRACARDGA